jgi:hypothetical protein
MRGSFGSTRWKGWGVFLHGQETGGNTSVFVIARELLKDVFLSEMPRRTTNSVLWATELQKTALFRVIAQRVVIISYRRFGTT